jgi:hypothetical protein
LSKRGFFALLKGDDVVLFPEFFSDRSSSYYLHNRPHFHSRHKTPPYWQQEVNYDIHVAMMSIIFRGDISIDYTNNSPDTLLYPFSSLGEWYKNNFR